MYRRDADERSGGLPRRSLSQQDREELGRILRHKFGLGKNRWTPESDDGNDKTESGDYQEGLSNFADVSVNLLKIKHTCGRKLSCCQHRLLDCKNIAGKRAKFFNFLVAVLRSGEHRNPIPQLPGSVRHWVVEFVGTVPGLPKE